MVRAGRRLRIAAWISGLLGLALLLGAGGVIATGYRSVTVMSHAMEPTLQPGWHVLLRRISPGQVRRGLVVAYQVPDRYQGKPVLQRVIGVGGDHIVDRPGHPLMVNGKPLAEPYVTGDPSAGTGPYEVVVPAGRLFLLGDHRSDAFDCRFFRSDGNSGTIPTAAVQARVETDVRGFLGLMAAASFGLLLVLTALVLGIAARIARKRSHRPPMSPDTVPPRMAGAPS